MKEPLETARLRLEAVGTTSLESLYPLWTLPEVRRHLFDDRVLSRAEARALLVRSEAAFTDHGAGLWAAHLGDALIGFVGLLWPQEESPVEAPSLVYGLAPESTGRGFAVEMARAVLAHAHEHCGLPVVLADVDEDNRASRRVLEHLGFRFVARRQSGDASLLYFESKANDSD